ncbi:MAG: DUF4157 domain-containing protein [Candidatus Obscuribacterales bacterium]|nr:DUF4157 domain-containing protein [Steroidobacteraceae bacterium]
MVMTHAPAQNAQAGKSSRNLVAAATRSPSRERMLGNRSSAQQNLVIGQRGDRFERQADAVAERFSTASDQTSAAEIAVGQAPNLQRQCFGCEQEQPFAPVQLKSLPGAAPSKATAAVSKLGGGQTLSKAVRQPLEQHLGYRFDQVRVHAGAAAAGSAQRMHARAYTSGSNIVFGRGEYAPHTSAGQKLLAHELTHVVQQGAASGAPDIQRAETDEEVGCSSLVDCSADINTEVNRVLGVAVAAAGTPVSANAVVDGAAADLGGLSPVSPIERWAERTLPATKIHQPAISATRYRGADTGLWRAFSRVLGPIVKIGSTCVGTDKLGHFFQQGMQYFERARRTVGGTSATADAFGGASEIGPSGLGEIMMLPGTGVYSNADLNANSQGLRFYDDLFASPRMTFDIASYANASWNEQNNPNFYTAPLATVVWNNLLANFPWRGHFDNSFVGYSGQPVEADFSVSAGTITGTYEYQNPTGAMTRGTFSNVTVTQRTTTVTGTSPFGSHSATPVSGIQLNFDWTEGSATGKGTWRSRAERDLEGSWGRSSSRVDGGAWNLRRS